jgi:hypothetical protein
MGATQHHHLWYQLSLVAIPVKDSAIIVGQGGAEAVR